MSTAAENPPVCPPPVKSGSVSNTSFDHGDGHFQTVSNGLHGTWNRAQRVSRVSETEGENSTRRGTDDPNVSKITRNSCICVARIAGKSFPGPDPPGSEIRTIGYVPDV